jgi:uncharacterized protein YrrD
MADSEEPIAWTALGHGAPVISSEGEEVGRVSDVVADEQRDIFSGIAFRARLLDHQRFVPAADIDAITTAGVRLTLTSQEAEKLEGYEG